MIEIRKGLTKKNASSEQLIKYFSSKPDLSGILYIGYPILHIGGESLTIDALLLTKEYGILIFDIVEGSQLGPDHGGTQDELYSKLKSLLIGHNQLNIKRNFGVPIETVTYAPAYKITKNVDFKLARSHDELEETVGGLEDWENSNLYEATLSVLQSVIKLKPKTNRHNITKSDSRGAIVRYLEETIANLDHNQEKAVIEYYAGVQRIRGLAGSGKTIVLALKAAYLHTINPEWKIAITFHTRSLKDQFKKLVERFCIEKKGELPDWSMLEIVNAWGSSSNPGIYSKACNASGAEYMDFKAARNNSFPSGDPFKYVCDQLLPSMKNASQHYDVILVDEAQDLSESFLKVCFHMLREPKRLIYAYDELQKLNEGTPLPNPKDMFKRDYDDIILDKCYRNSRPILVSAHALGFGIYREKGLVQFFDQPQLWQEVGYEIESGNLKAGQTVTLSRNESSSPAYLENHSPVEDIVSFKSFQNSEKQCEWIAKEIIKNIEKDELLPNDILIINPIALTTKREVGAIRFLLAEKGINTHLAGEFDADIFYKEDSVAFTGIYRAKGNESPMVYIINAQDCYSGVWGDRQLTNRRNILFTSMTRSKAWIRVCGVGGDMEKLSEEYGKVKRNGFKLQFPYPSIREIEKINLIHRDLSNQEINRLKKESRTLQELGSILNRIKSGEALIEDYPEDMQQLLLDLTDRD